MHFFSRNKALIAASVVAMGALAACGDDVTVPPAQVNPVVITLNPQNSTVNIGESITLSAQITGGSTTTPPTLASCTSSNTAVLTASMSGSACTVTGVAAGNASVTAAASTGQQTSAAVTVNSAAAAISNLSVPSSLTARVGQTVTIVPSVTRANSANTVTYSYQSSTPAVATVNANGVVTAVGTGTATITVTATGSGAGFSNTTLTQGVVVVVTDAPPSVTGVQVTPTSLALALGASDQINVNAPRAAGAPNNTITYSSTNTAIATVNANGVVTAVAPGNATINVRVQNAGTATLAAYDNTFSVAVSVAPAAVVSLIEITQGPTMTSYNNTAGNEGLVTANNPNVGQIVDVDNVRDQINVKVNLITNGQRVDSIVLYVADQNSNNRRSAARQTYPSGQASNGEVGFSIRTDDFSVNTTTGAVDVKYPNGLRRISASIWSTSSSGVATEQNQAIAANTLYNFRNVDSWALIYVAPQRTAQGGIGSNPNLNWHGGPGAAGDGSWTIFPVFYTPGRTLQTVQTGLGVAVVNPANPVTSGSAANLAGTTPNSPVVQTPNCTGVRTFTPGTGLMQVTFGSSAATATRINCTGWEHAAADASNIPYIIGAIDNSNNSAPIVRSNTGFRASPTVMQPVALRLDYDAPDLTVAAPLTQWASGVIANPYSFATNSTGADQGVGIDAGFGRSFTFSGCGGTFTNVAVPTGTASDIPECPNNVNATATAYRVTVNGVDRLGNANSAQTGTFGIDNVAPDIRYSASGANATPGQGPGSALDTTTYTILANTIFTGASFVAPPAVTDTIFGVEVDDERSGLTATSASHFLVRANQLNPTGTCLVGTGTPGAAFLTAPTCGFTTSGAGVGTPMVDGFRPVARILGQVLVTNGEAYYAYQARVMDLAGNMSTTPVRRVLYDVTNPILTGLGIPSVVTAAGPNTFTPNVSELVEVHFTNLMLSYSGLQNPAAGADANLAFPAQLYNARFDNSIAPNGNFSIGTPFTSGVNVYTNIEQVDAAGNVVVAAGSARPDSASARVVDAAGLPSGFTISGQPGVALLGPNVQDDATTWSTFNSAITSWALGQNIAQFNAPAQGLKAVLTAPATPQNINSPFTRVDFYEFVSGVWLFVGSVDGTQVGCTNAAQANCSLYIFDNGVTRRWTYRLTAPMQLNSLAQGTAFGNLGGGARRFMAIGTNGIKGRGLATNATQPASQVQP